MDNFDLKKYLVENKVTTNSKMLNEEAAGMSPAQLAVKLEDKLEDLPIMKQIADKIANDPELMQQYQAGMEKLGVAMKESMSDPTPQEIAKVTSIFMNKLTEGQDATAEAAMGMLGTFVGGTIAHMIYSKPVLDSLTGMDLGQSTAAMTETLLGALAGAALFAIGTFLAKKAMGK